MGRKHHGHSRSKTRDLISLIFSFFLSIVVLGIALLLVLRFGVLSEHGVKAAMSDEFYQSVKTYAEEESNYYTLPTGINPSVLDGAFVEDEIRESIDGYVSAAFSGGNYTPNVNPLRERLTQNVVTLLSSEGAEDAQAIADSYASEIVDIYAAILKIPGLDAVQQVNGLFTRYFPIAIAGLALFAIVLIVLIVRLHHFLHRSLRYVAYAMGGAMLMSFVVPFIVYQSQFYTGLSVEPEYFYLLCVSLISHALTRCMWASLALLVATIIIIAYCAVLRKKAMRRHHSHHDF